MALAILARRQARGRRILNIFNDRATNLHAKSAASADGGTRAIWFVEAPHRGKPRFRRFSCHLIPRAATTILVVNGS
ncbi:hypothetical protein E6W36_15555 [Hankyongella ginsenosidimutans]|uniref:Uncharacterized protein n=1 Tax=Hankyongella ginsenosidimutans TaxID=1763828 RepID=A0A4D7C5M0_9SPHN|nr:hypothetical protein [Hankyongella ginsenosidimutans]QCI80421.1 hypothetical protein E6W36_15555 [Hankyongella ginsenosidimutans]